MKWFTAIMVSLLAIAPATAAESVYTKLDLDNGCVFHSEYELGASAYCSGYKGYPVHFSEGDLRQMVRFGHLKTLDGQWESFGRFNRVNDTIEWRLKDGKPYAAILRWFIEIADSNGNYSDATNGQVLVVSSIASHEKPVSCVVGYVDARANKGANEIAQKVADELAGDFQCGTDKPVYHGERSAKAGNPNRHFE